ncbi:MAG: hypothetical protein H8E60_06860 [Candidatus Marinimicrobia bacterium]|nr:hypothetical protein [Candidatus Neomarinimicrobiota bacterium]
MKNSIKLSFLLLSTILFFQNCEKISQSLNLINGETTDPNLVYTCESCHMSYDMLNKLANPRGEAGGGG